MRLWDVYDYSQSSGYLVYAESEKLALEKTLSKHSKMNPDSTQATPVDFEDGISTDRYD